MLQAGEIDFVFGPDGVGKDTFVDSGGELDDYAEAVRLSGTNINAWQVDHPDLYESGLLVPYQPDEHDFMGKIRHINVSAGRLAAEGMAVMVVGPAWHKTAINVAAGRFSVPGHPAGTDVEMMLDGEFGTDMLAFCAGNTVTHTQVVMEPGESLESQALELQLRMTLRPGGRSEWDPQTSDESANQLQAADQLAQGLHNRKLKARRVVSRLDA